MSPLSWTPERMDRLERAIAEGARIHIRRRGTDYTLLPRSVGSEGATEVLLATTVAGDERRFRLDEIEEFVVL